MLRIKENPTGEIDGFVIGNEVMVGISWRNDGVDYDSIWEYAESMEQVTRWAKGVRWMINRGEEVFRREEIEVFFSGKRVDEMIARGLVEEI